MIRDGTNGPFTVDSRQLGGVGARISWLDPEVKRRVCNTGFYFGPDPNAVEIMMMRGMAGPPAIHRHHRGDSMLLVLGPEQGFPEPTGVTLMGTPRVGEGSVEITPHRNPPGTFIYVSPGTVHGFFSEVDDGLVAIGIQDPPIRVGDEFDIEDLTLEADGKTVLLAT